MLMLDWAHKMKADGVKVWAVAPGFLETDLGGMREMAKKMGTGPASLGGKIMREVVEGERDADVGKLIDKNGVMEW
jgi:NAD(P)-dependent dehydrogenase (short-subunit alcohol dehydrogenase family)